jgi:hypothetical protein
MFGESTPRPFRPQKAIAPTMTELLALPDWQTPPRTLDEWVAALSGRAGQVAVVRESTTVVWLEVGSLRLRGYAVLEGVNVEAINFELADPDPAPATLLLEEVARSLGWELHADEPGDDSDDDE